MQTKAAEYARKFYDHLNELAVDEQVEDKEVRVYRGKITEAFNELGIASLYYTKTRRIFLEYGCTTVLERGTKAYPSVVILNHPPPEIVPAEVLTYGAEPASIVELDQRLRAVEDWRDSTTGGLNIGDAIRELDVRLAKIEKERVNGKKPQG